MRSGSNIVDSPLRYERSNNQSCVSERKMDERNDSGKARLIGTVFYARRYIIFVNTLRTVYLHSEVYFARDILSDSTCDKRTARDTERTLFIDGSRGGTE